MTASFALLRVHLPPQGLTDAPLDWLGLNGSGQAQARGTTLLADLPPSDRLELILPASRVAAHRIELPALTGKHEAALIRQALEDRALGDLAASVIVSGARQDKLLCVWVCERAWLERQLANFASLRQADLLTPEQALLAPGQHAETPSGWIFQRAPGEYGLLPSQDLLLSLCPDSQAIDTLLTAPPINRVNLLVGLPGLRRAQASFSLAQLKPALWLLIAAALIYLLAQVLEWRQLAAREANLRQSIRQNFAAANPGVPIVDPILQWRQSRGQPGQQGGDALDQLARFAALSGLSLKPARIESEEGRLKLTLTTTDANQLKPILQGKGISFESQTTDKGLEQLIIKIDKGQP
ncbi:type II secretion system protein GspL [Uliginosibacterium aquaticum]|uniref:GspL cytoplasmic actin-ATPase-like domain-containing protein n=1 Tax=Uliginosibacterium aquaticum TaxID=2731212 RepID=A0ABX2IHI4_9RHOO|nr:type II secretion system protein GspL [Uliginosibacterium aquaticum]NSL54099.1 hypothetical protein [Uliginosibacterium aquaticum]